MEISPISASSIQTAAAMLKPSSTVDTSGAFAEQLHAAAKRLDDTKDQTKLKDACRDMEAVFLNLMMQKMRDTVPKSTLTDGGNAENIMRSMLDSELTKNMAQAGGIGLADMLYRQLSMATTTTPAAALKNQAPR